VFDSGQKLWKFKKTQHMGNHTDREVSQGQQQSTKPPFPNNQQEAKNTHILLQQARLLLPISSYFYQVLQCQLEDIHTPRPKSFLFTTSALPSMCMGSLVSLPTPHPPSFSLQIPFHLLTTELVSNAPWLTVIEVDNSSRKGL